ncbi:MULTISPECIES: tyrosine-type recombinase/integrase [unclassified Thiocapsa]|uniref:tyrosine-type recombinase/integrase n=1 Tax=unclassified Thiocapsa TaxID=2641286 RepID=UPI0035B3C695
MATIEKLQRESGPVYKAVVRKQGHGKQTKTFKTRSAAERWSRQLEARIEQDDAGLTNEAQRHTLGETITKYRAEVLPEKRPTTARPYGIHLDYWDQKLGHLKLSELTATKIDACRDEIAAGSAPATVNRYLATLASVCTAAVKRWHWLTTNPLRQVAKPQEGNGGTRFLTREELPRLLDACRQSASPDLYLAVLLSLTTGARQQELLGLRWKDVDLHAGLLHLRVENETTTKGGIRAVPIAPEALDLLKARKAERDRKEDQTGKVRTLRDPGLVFPARVTVTKPVDLRTPWETALKRAGIEGFRWHDMRHSAASFLAKGGASLLEIGAVLGHKSAATSKRYSHLTAQHTHDLVRSMTADLFGEGKP